MPLYNIQEIPSCNLIEGYDAQFIHTAQATYSHVKAQAGAVLPTHSHPQEQVSYILEGKFELTVEDVPYELSPGQVFVIPSNALECIRQNTYHLADYTVYVISLDSLEFDTDITDLLERSIGDDAEPGENSAILKDEDRCIRCALCAMRCPVDAISMERVTFTTNWSSV